MISLNNKGFFWKSFHDNGTPIEPKECELVFSPREGGTLIYLSEFNEGFDSEKDNNKNIKLLYGQDNQGNQFTLYYLTLLQYYSPTVENLQITEVRYSIKYIFYKGWIDMNKPFNSLHVRYSYLEIFFNQLVKKQNNNQEQNIACIYANKENINTSQNNEILFNINNCFNENTFNNKLVKYEFNNSLWICKKNNIDIENLILLSLKIRYFFELITCFSKNKIFIEEIYINHSVLHSYNKEDLVFLLFKQEDYKSERKMYHTDFLFRYEDIKENFSEILNHWVHNNLKYENEFNAFCNVISDKSTKFNIYSHYFQLVSALEGYHRKRNNEKDRANKENHKNYLTSLKNKLKEVLEGKECKKLLFKLKYSYGTHFKDRIAEVIEQSEIKRILKLDDQIYTSILKFIKETRNNIAHLEENMNESKKVESLFELIKLVVVLIMIREIALTHRHFSEYIFDMDIKNLEEELIYNFGVSR